MKLNTEACKSAIAEHCKTRVAEIGRDFVPPLAYADVLPALSPGNWKRLAKERTEEGLVMRSFDCRPFDDQLRAYVLSSRDDDCIVSIVVQGE